MNQVELNADEIKNYLNHIVSNNRHIQKQGKTPIATEVIGESGLGKTSVTLQVTKELGMHHVKMNLAQIEELGDLIGFPVRQFQMVKGGTVAKPAAVKTVKKIVIVEGKKVLQDVPITTAAVTTSAGTPEWVDEVATTQYATQGYTFTGKKRMSYCPPEWIADKTGGGFLILDDWNRADIRFIQAVMELVDRQEYISWKLPDDWHILLTANPDNGEYLVQAMDVAQKTRFMSIVMKWDRDCWAKWAEEDSIDGRCINFMLFHEDIVEKGKGKVNPRSLTNFFNSISSFDSFEDNLPMIQNLGEGSVGPEVALMFTGFINNRMDKWISPHDILLEEKDTVVLTAMKDMFGTGNDYRADIASVLTTRLINYALTYAEKNPIGPEIINRLNMLVKEDGIFTDDLKYHIVKKILNGNKQKYQKMLVDTEVQELATK
jgi:hypothetical protein